MSEKRNVRFGIVGCGLMGQRHGEVLRATPGAEVVAAVDTSREAAEKVCPGGAFDTYDALLEQSGLDAVVLCLPSSLHADYGILAARRGIHVVTEKPIDIDPAKGRRLAEECRAAGVVCAVICQNRFSEGAMALKGALANGLLAPVRLIDASVKWMRHDPYYTDSNWRGTFQWEGGGVIMNQGIHTIDLLCWMFGRPVAVKGLTRRNRPYMETEDVAVGIMEFPGGELCTLSVTTSSFPNSPEQISFHGPKASARLEKGRVASWSHDEEQPEPTATLEGATDGLAPNLLLFQRQYRNILGAIHGEEDLLVTAEESIAVLETALALYQKHGGDHHTCQDGPQNLSTDISSIRVMT